MPEPLPLPGAPDVAYLLDLSSIARGLFETLPAAQTAEGEPVAVTAAVVHRLVRLLRSHDPAFLAVCADMPTTHDPDASEADGRLRRSWRAGIWSGYKADRVPPGPEYDTQIDRLLDVFQAHRVPVFRAPGREADDFFGALVPRLRRLGLRVVIVSKDHDLWQLLGEGVMAWDGVSTTGIGPADVEAKYGVPPDLLADVLALAGDGDEAPGLPGIGLKTAAELVNQHRPRDRSPAPGETLELVLARWSWKLGAKGKVTKLAASLRDGGEAARLSLRLVYLGEDVPVALDVAEMRVGWTEADAERIRVLGAELSIPAMREVEGFEKRELPGEIVARLLG